jgi:uncharacterized protein (DUF362 family)
MQASAMSSLSLAKITNAGIAAALERALEPFSSRIACMGKRVLIKPNLVEPVACTTGQTTNPDLVEAIVLWCQASGAAEIAIGEGPSYFQPRRDLRACFERTGMAAVAQRRKIRWIVFDDENFVAFRNYSPATPPVFHLSEHAFCWDCIINVPIPKAHYLTTVSIAMKNLKGFIMREEKPSFHYCGQDGIHGSVAQLCTIIRPDLNVVDCSLPLHCDIPFILAGEDIVAVDAFTTALMGINPGSIQTIVLGHAAGLGESDLSRIDILGDDLAGISMRCEAPHEYIKRAFPSLRLHASRACSGCLIPLFAALRRLENLGHTCCREVVSGKEPGCEHIHNAVFIGTCACMPASCGPRLAQCPPTKETVFEFLKKNLSEKGMP